MPLLLDPSPEKLRGCVETPHTPFTGHTPVNKAIRSKCCNHKNQKKYCLQKNSYYINEKNNDKEDEINIYNDVNNLGDNSGNNNDEN